METLLRYHMAVVTPDKRLKRAIKRVTTATASTADYCANLASLSKETDVDFAILDAREQAPTKEELANISGHASIAYILDDENLIRTVDMLSDPRVSSLLCHDEAFDDDEFIASATKALRGDVFGLQKYFPWGVTTYSMVVKNYEQKTRAIEIIMQYARQAGMRGPVRDRIQLVSDELMMNGLYHAPVDEEGRELYRNVSRKDLTKLDEVQAIEVNYGCSGRYFGLSIRDFGGSLTREKALEYLMRAKNATTQIETKSTGAGLGLISVLRSVSKLIFNLDPGASTEVIALFDMNLFSKGKVGARSLHVFMADDVPEQEDWIADDQQSLIESGDRAGTGSSPWLLAALLLGLLIVGLGITYSILSERGGSNTATEQAEASIAVVPVPDDASITVNGTSLQAGTTISLPEGQDRFDVVVSKPGHRTWRRQIERSQVRGAVQLFVTLERQPR